MLNCFWALVVFGFGVAFMQDLVHSEPHWQSLGAGIFSNYILISPHYRNASASVDLTPS